MTLSLVTLLAQQVLHRYVHQTGTALFNGIHSFLPLQECSDFLAGNALRSKSRYARLDETAVMGVVCRHGHPLCFCNL